MIRRLAIALVFLLGATVVSFAQGVQICYQGASGLNCQAVSASTPLPVTGGQGTTTYTPIAGSAQYNFTVASATPLTVPTGANFARVSCAGQTVDYTIDGTTPTSSVGFALTVGAYLYLQSNAAIKAWKGIQTASTATCDADYYQ